MMNFSDILKRFNEFKVKYVLIGGGAAIAHGSAYVTADADICYARDEENLQRLAAALQPLHPKLRGAPEGLPFKLDASTLNVGLNFTLTTDLGDLDLLGEVAGLGTYEAVSQSSDEVNSYGVQCRVLSLEGLIKAKRAAGRPKDQLILPELEALLELRRSLKKQNQ
jgi:predicted nucleotidyltransferase